MLLYLLPYKNLSTSFGFCDTNSTTNDALEAARTRCAAVEACQRENRTLLYIPFTSTPVPAEEQPPACPPPAVLPARYPDECTPCPDHARCAPDSVVCEDGYLIRPHPLLFFLPFPDAPSIGPTDLPGPANSFLVAVSNALNGLPGLGSVALPPRCVLDPKRVKRIGTIGKAVETQLGLQRGKRLCVGGSPAVKEEDGGEARRWGYELGFLKEEMRRKTPPNKVAQFEMDFQEAIKELMQWERGVWQHALRARHRQPARG
ncbi:hypothetical protein FA95DRAFT_158979 [Auriscalpium vulgare]|uniref:Uncharacterized protein n=1 Tax=Auriscalpium vulgare TaxID=40419 RepID=A0ACB8RMK7_9AGAM|nr:hypothetical protein FA95DRAFT_158979 [Auriscalpium vulgare]